MNSGDIFIGFDADERNLKLASEKLESLKTKTKVILIHSNFSNLQERLVECDIDSITGIYYDL
jgi:16S rRNA C1402 N4-methylase RsmH